VKSRVLSKDRDALPSWKTLLFVVHAPYKYENIQWEEHALEIDTFSLIQEQFLALTIISKSISPSWLMCL